MIVIICFFLPWEQVSCGGASDTLSGLDLARHGHPLLWLVPLLMLAVFVIGILRQRNEKPLLFSIVSLIASLVSMFLMNDERQRVQDASGVISARLTGWFWLSFFSSLAVLITGIARILARGSTRAETSK